MKIPLSEIKHKKSLQRKNSASKPSICLCMIVKNEAACIRRCLESVKGLIDTYMIIDTGSTDRTVEIISETLGERGLIIKRPWVNFGHNRSEALHYAAGRGDYLLLLDADMTINVHHNIDQELTADAYHLRFEESTEYWLPLLVKSRHPWRYEGVTHEYLTSNTTFTTDKCHILSVKHWGDGGTRYEKLDRDLELLSNEYKKDPKNTRTVFYLAQTAKDRGDYKTAASLYEERVALGGWDEEVYYSKLQLGHLYDLLGEEYRCLYQFARAWNYRPQRLEALYELVCRLRTKGLHYAAYQLLKDVCRQSIEPTTDILFVAQWVWDWGLLFEYSIVSYYAGHKDDAWWISKQLLKNKNLPNSYREQVEKNLEYMRVQK